MLRALHVVVVVCALAAGASASTMQFAVDGVPIGPGEDLVVLQGYQYTVGIYIEPDPGSPIEYWCVEFLASGPWVPLPQPTEPEWPDLIASGDVRMLPPWDNEYPYKYAEATWSSLSGTWLIVGALFWDLWDGPGVVAEFDVNIPDVPADTLLGLEFSTAELDGPGLPGPLPDDVFPLVLHTMPEPATLGLLALGVLAAIRRRR